MSTSTSCWFTPRTFSVAIIFSLSLDLIWLVLDLSIPSGPWCVSGLTLLATGVLLSNDAVQLTVLSNLIKIQRAALLSPDSKVPVIAGTLLFLLGSAEAIGFLFHANAISVLVSIWILAVVIITTRKELRIRSTSIKNISERKAILRQRVILQDHWIACLPILLIRTASSLISFDLYISQNPALIIYLSILTHGAIMLLCFPEETIHTTLCSHCRGHSPRSLALLGECPSCSAAPEHAAPAKAFLLAKRASS